jgi:small subunit ribosomal protein S3Ae
MAYGKNKKLSKGKKGGRKKQLDPFVRKNWYDVKAPTFLNSQARRAGRTPVTKTTGQRIETDGLKGRVAEFNLADLALKNDDSHKKVKLEVQDISGRSCLTDFHGLSLTRDRMNHMIRKRHSLIETKVDVKTLDGYVVRLFVIAFTKDTKDQVRIFSYAQSAQIKKIRKKITALLQTSVGAGSLKDLVQFLVSDKLEADIRSACQSIYPLDPVHLYKVKLVRKPKVDITKLMELHEGAPAAEDGVAMDDVAEESKNLLAA